MSPSSAKCPLPVGISPRHLTRLHRHIGSLPNIRSQVGSLPIEHSKRIQPAVAPLHGGQWGVRRVGYFPPYPIPSRDIWQNLTTQSLIAVYTSHEALCHHAAVGNGFVDYCVVDVENRKTYTGKLSVRILDLVCPIQLGVGARTTLYLALCCSSGTM